ncbi:hypothetical protein AAHH18_08175 [Cellulomonas sp. P4]
MVVRQLVFERFLARMFHDPFAEPAMDGTDGDQPPSRVRDLVDLEALARSQDVDGSTVISAVEGEWTPRGPPGSPVLDGWAAGRRWVAADLIWR